MRKGLDHFDDTLDQHVGPAAVITGDAADQDAEAEADDHTDETDGQRDPRAVNDARQQVAAEPVSAEEKHLPVRRRTEQVEIARDEPPVIIPVAMAKEAD